MDDLLEKLLIIISIFILGFFAIVSITHLVHVISSHLRIKIYERYILDRGKEYDSKKQKENTYQSKEFKFQIDNMSRYLRWKTNKWVDENGVKHIEIDLRTQEEIKKDNECINKGGQDWSEHEDYI